MTERRLVIIRHAKSSWANPGQQDFDRPLNDRGEHDAPMMGERLRKRDILPDVIITSPAKRAVQTAKRISTAVGYDKGQIRKVDQLYHCTPSVLEELILSLDAELKTVFIIAHNPGITEFVNTVSDTFRIDNVPTCGVTVIQLSADNWTNFLDTQKQVLLFDYPKNK